MEQDFLDKWRLKANDAILADDSHRDLYKEMTANFKCEYIAGGSVQNTLRAAQWMIQRENCMTFMGGIGDDHFGRLMADNSRQQGLNAIYMISKDTPTGTCACLISHGNTCRSLVAYLGASQKFHIDHVKANQQYVEKAMYFYVSGYHLAVSTEAILHVANHAHSSADKLFAMNLSAPYISQAFSKQLLEVYPYVDLLFGNETETQAFADLNDWKVWPLGSVSVNLSIISYLSQTKDLKTIAQLMADKECKRASGRTVIVTQGKDGILVAFTGKKEVKEFPVKHLDQSKIVDTIGAGDAFVGGFFAQMVRNKPLEVCIDSGVYCAQEVIQQIGAHFPKDMKYKS